MRNLAFCGVFGLIFGAAATAQTPVARAVRIETPPRVDGVLDEPFWAGIEPITGFRQRDPVDGAPASEPTEVRIAYDERALYFGFSFFDSEPDRIRRAILHRGGRIDKDDRILIGIDTYFDRRSAYLFEVGALGAQDDALLSDERLDREDWNWDGVFTTATTVNAEGWALEMALPFTTIRFADEAAPVMGIAFQRSIRRKNETVIWPHIGQEYRSGIAQVSRYATLVGLEGVRRGQRLEMKPYGTLGAQRLGGGRLDREAQAGLDVKYGLTPNLTLDLTWNTDFAQVEADNVQINLTRFDLFFPEKREFFLERAGLFRFGAPQETEIFFSRRIGLEDDILGGGRLTGQAGPLSVGALALRTGNRTDGPGAWNSVLRLEAGLGERTTVGAIATSLDQAGRRGRRTAGVDFVTRFFSSSSLRLWGARVFNDATAGDASAADGELQLRNDRYSLSLRRGRVGKDFDPALGFARRRDQDRWSGAAAFTPRFEASRWARQARFQLEADRILGTDGELQSRATGAATGFSFESGDQVDFSITNRFERLRQPASISGRALPAGDYDFRFVEASARTNDSRTVAAMLSGSAGGFWGGERARLAGGVVVKTGPHLTVQATASRNRVSLPIADGAFTTHLLAFDVQGALNLELFAGALIQWDSLSKELRTNIRVNWIHTPGSDLFLVLDTGYITDGDPGMDPRIDPWTRRTAVAKLTWLKAF